MSKRAQSSGAGAAVLVAIIAAFIVLYILFLPPPEREALLEDGTGARVTGTEAPGGNLLLKESPGRLDFLEHDEIEHSLPSVNLFSTTTSVLLSSIDSVYVKNGWFDKASRNISFAVDDLAHTTNVQAVFNIDKPEETTGKLILKLNGEEIFRNSIATRSVPPITLSKSLIKEDNVLEVSAEDVGMAFWRTNDFTLKTVKIIGDVTDISTQKATNMFIVSSTEKNNLDRVFVRFFPHCRPTDVGILNIFLNDKEIFSAVPDCGLLRTMEILPSTILSGENTLAFSTNKGAYLIDQVSVKSELKELTFPTYYFEVSDSRYASIRGGRSRVTLRMKFADAVETKKAEIFINGYSRGFTTKERVYELEIGPYISKGNNVVEIKPLTTLDVVDLEVLIR